MYLSKQRQQSELDRDKNRNKFYAFITFKSPFPSSINISVKHNYKNENNNQFNTLIKLIRSSYKAVFKMVSMIFCGPTLPLSVPLAWTSCNNVERQMIFVVWLGWPSINWISNLNNKWESYPIKIDVPLEGPFLLSPKCTR